MPTVFRKSGYRFFFYSNEHFPPHIHIEKGEKTAKYNIEDGELVLSRGFNSSELREIRKLVDENLKLFKDKWD